MKNLRPLARRSRSTLSRTRRRGRLSRRRLISETLECRQLLASDLEMTGGPGLPDGLSATDDMVASHNYLHSLDVDNNRRITARDALMVVNHLQRQGSGEAAAEPEGFVDVNGDGLVTAGDALQVINGLARGEGVGELLELTLDVSDGSNQLIVPDALGEITLPQGGISQLDLGFVDMRSPFNRLGVFQYFADIGVSAQGIVNPTASETQRFIFSHDLVSDEIFQDLSGNLVIEFEGQTAQIPLSDLLPGGEFSIISETEKAFVEQLGFEAGQVEASFNNPNQFLGQDDPKEEDVILSVRFTGADQLNVNFDAAVVNVVGSSVPVQSRVEEINPLNPNGSINNAAVTSNFVYDSRVFGGTYFGDFLSFGEFDSLTGGYDNVGSVAFPNDVVPGNQLTSIFDSIKIPFFAGNTGQVVVNLNPHNDEAEDMDLEGVILWRDQQLTPDEILFDTATQIGSLTESLDESDSPLMIDLLGGTVESDGRSIVTINVTSDGNRTTPLDVANLAPQAGTDDAGVTIAADGLSLTVDPTAYAAKISEGETETVVYTYDVTDGTKSVAYTLEVTIDGEGQAQAGVLDISPVTTSVGEGDGNVSLTVTRSGNTNGAVSVAFATADGTATAGANEDYVQSSDTLDFADGETTKTIMVPINEDDADEPDETFTVTLSNVTGNATLGDSVSTVTILDNDVTPVPGMISISPETISVDEDAGNVMLNVTRGGGSDGPVSVQLATANGTATAGSDYTATNVTVSFADGETSQSVSIPINDDGDDEPDETFTATISNPTGGATLGSTTVSTVTILDNDIELNPGTINIGPAAISVDEDAGNVMLNVTRSGGSDGPVSVQLATANGTATAGSDYTATNVTVNFADGETSQSVSIPINDDGDDEPDETFTATISNPTGGATLGGTTVSTVTILDNDIELNPGTINIGPAAISVDEDAGNVMLNVTRSGGSDGPVSVQLATANGTATAGSDYTTTNVTVNFADGETSQSVSIPINDDGDDEPDETFTATISNPTGGATLGGTTESTVTILDNDEPPVPGTLSFSQAAISVNESGGMATLTVSRTVGSDGAVSVDFATANGAAIAGQDYTASNGTLNFADGVTSATIDVPILMDVLDEGDEDFTVMLSNPGGGAVLGATTTSTVTILANVGPNDPPVVSGPIEVTFSEDDLSDTVDLLLGASDPDDDPLMVTNLQRQSGNAAGITEQGDTLQVNPAIYGFLLPGDTETIVYSYNVSDGAESVSQTATIQITGVNDAPVAADDSFTVFLNGTTDLSVLNNDDAGSGEDEILTVTVDSVMNGSATVNGDGSIAFTPAQLGPATVEYTVTDESGATDSATASISVEDFIPVELHGAIFIDHVNNINAVVNAGAAPIRDGEKDPDEKGLSGIVVRMQSNGTMRTAITDLNGEYKFDEVGPGDYTITFEPPSNVVFVSPASRQVSVDGEGDQPDVMNFPLLGTQGSAFDTVDILASTYMQRDSEMSAMTNGGLEGGLVSLNASGDQGFLIAGEGYDGVSHAEFTLNDAKDAALLTLIMEGTGQELVARLSQEHFVVTRDGLGARFFGAFDDLDFVQTTQALQQQFEDEFDNYRNVIDQVIASLFG